MINVFFNLNYEFVLFVFFIFVFSIQSKNKHHQIILMCYEIFKILINANPSTWTHMISILDCHDPYIRFSREPITLKTNKKNIDFYSLYIKICPPIYYKPLAKLMDPIQFVITTC